MEPKLGMWIWHLEKLAPDVIPRLAAARIPRVYLKVVDSTQPALTWDHVLTRNALEPLRRAGLEIFAWGTHTLDVPPETQAAAVARAMEHGFSGYVLNLQAELQDKNTPGLRRAQALLESVRKVLPAGTFGATALLKDGFHPSLPWKLIDGIVDALLPFAVIQSDSEGTLLELFATHRSLRLDKPIFPVLQPNISRADVVDALARSYPGISLWRGHKSGENSQLSKMEWNDFSIHNQSPNAPATDSPPVVNPSLPPLKRVLRLGSGGADVSALQARLRAHGITAPGTGVFDAETRSAVRQYQAKGDLTPDGVVGPQTWIALGGELEQSKFPNGVTPNAALALALADFAENEAKRRLTWTGLGCEAEKYVAPFRPEMIRLDQLGEGERFVDWCGAFVYYCATHVGLNVPLIPNGFYATMAKTHAWIHWAKLNGYFYKDLAPRRGDILTFDWNLDKLTDHVAICTGYLGEELSLKVLTAEGNRSNWSGNFFRHIRHVSGVIRIT